MFDGNEWVILRTSGSVVVPLAGDAFSISTSFLEVSQQRHRTMILEMKAQSSKKLLLIANVISDL